MDTPTHPIVLGLWPIAGVTTIGVTQADAAATIRAAIDSGITRFDTAFSYGYDGESDKALRPFLQQDRDRYFVIGKVGQRWTEDKKRVIDGSHRQLVADAETSLRRLGIERFDTLMLHSIDPKVEIEISACAIEEMRQRGLAANIGVCNVDESQYQSFKSVAHCDAIQTPLNWLQRHALDELIPACAADDCKVYVYWTLMKGLLSGGISRDHRFAEGDSRPGYSVFQGEARARTHDILDALGPIADREGLTVGQLSIGWAISQPGVTAALVGARRADQILETSQAVRLGGEVVEEMNEMIESAGS
ncbi:General stress protein 69 [Novipirellula aureliae]|uniref:General stress protein 69 n=1 Tax=Novipirellula aureliae TaxID=2527966 RepID=A0A5C6E250_9BACT|nr:aldo/keto reductase [Novipirellula aureliae]TWU41456.1 General stress protein 69 [Novipirellula aureliae]